MGLSERKPSVEERSGSHWPMGMSGSLLLWLLTDVVPCALGVVPSLLSFPGLYRKLAGAGEMTRLTAKNIRKPVEHEPLSKSERSRPAVVLYDSCP